MLIQVQELQLEYQVLNHFFTISKYIKASLRNYNFISMIQTRSLRTSFDVFLSSMGKTKDSFISTDADIKPQQHSKENLNTHENLQWIPQWNSISECYNSIQDRQTNRNCPFCGQFISSLNSESIMGCFFKKNTRIYLSHLACLQTSNFSLSQRLNDLIEATVYDQKLTKQHRLLILGQKQFYVELKITHPLSSFTYFKGFKKLIYHGSGVMWDFQQEIKSKKDILLQPNMVCIPVSELKILLSIKDMSKKEVSPEEFKIFVDLNDSIQTGKNQKQSQQKSFTVNKGASVIKFQFSVFQQKVQKQLIFNELNYKYKYSINNTQSLVRINQLQIQMKNLSVSQQQSIFQELSANQQKDEYELLFSPNSKDNQKLLRFPDLRNSAVSQQADLQDQYCNDLKMDKKLMSSQRISINSPEKVDNLKKSENLSSCRQIRLTQINNSPEVERILANSSSPLKNKLKQSQFSHFSNMSQISMTSIHSMKSSNSSINGHFENIFCNESRVTSIQKRTNYYHQNIASQSPPRNSINFYYEDFNFANNQFGQQIPVESANQCSIISSNPKQLKEYVCSHSGSKQFQKTMQHMKPNEVDHIIQVLYEQFPQLIIHQYANYMFQSLIMVCSLQQRLTIIQSLVGTGNKFGQLVSTKQGTFALQQFISFLTQDQQFQAICQAINNTKGKNNSYMSGFIKLSKDSNATYFIRKMIKSFPVKFILPFAQFSAANQNVFFNMVIDKNAICVVKAFFSVMDGSKRVDQETKFKIQKIKRSMIQLMAQLTNEIIIDPYGNYIIQEAYSLFKEKQLQQISQSIIKNFVYYSGEKYSNSVLLKCVKQYWHDHGTYNTLKKTLSQADVISMYKSRQGNRILLQIVEHRQSLPLKDKIQDAILNVEPSKFYAQRWVQSQRKSKTGVVGTSFTSFSQAVKQVPHYNQNQNYTASYRQKKPNRWNGNENNRAMKKSNIIPMKKTQLFER